MWGLALSALTIGLSEMLGKRDYTDEKVALRLSLFSGMSSDDRIFLSGAVLGVGCSLLCSTILSQFRLVERFRLTWRYFWNTNESIVLFPFRRPKPLVDDTIFEGELLENAVEQADDGSVRLLVTPQTAATGTLHVSLICIGKGRELPSCYAPAVEFYYVVSCPDGGCSFSQQGVTETSILKTGDCFVVDAGNMRWITNRAGLSPLLLLRVTDGGSRYNRPNSTEQIKLDPTLKKNQNRNSYFQRVTTMERLKDGLRQVHDLALKYVAKKPSDGKEEK